MLNNILLLEGFVPAGDFFKKLYNILLKNPNKIVNEFDKKLFKELSLIYEKELDKKTSKKMLNQVLKKIILETGINLKDYVKYFYGIINYLENKSDVSFYDSLNLARVFENFLYPDMNQNVKKSIDTGKFDFEKLASLVFRYQNFYANEKKVDKNLIYSKNGLNVYYPKTFMSFLKVIKDSGYHVGWCTQSRNTWYTYSSRQAIMIIEIEKSEPDTNKFGVDDSFRLISLKVSYDGEIDYEGTCDLNNVHMSKKLSYLNLLQEIQDAIYDNVDQLEKPELEEYDSFIALINEFLVKGNKKTAEDMISRLVISSSFDIDTCEETFEKLAEIKDEEYHTIKLEDCIDSSIIEICFFNIGIDSLTLFLRLKFLGYNTTHIFEKIIEKANKKNLKAIYQVCSNNKTKFFDDNSNEKNIFDFISYEKYNDLIKELLDRKIPDLTLSLMKKNATITHILSDDVLSRIVIESGYLESLKPGEILKLGKERFKNYLNELNRRGMINSIDNNSLKLAAYLYTEDSNNLDEEEKQITNDLLDVLDISNSSVYSIASIDENISLNVINQIINMLVDKKDMLNYIKFSSAYLFRETSQIKKNIELRNILNLFGPRAIIENNNNIIEIIKDIKYAITLRINSSDNKSELNDLAKYLSNNSDFDFYKSVTFNEIIDILSLKYEEDINLSSKEYGIFINLAFKDKLKFIDYLSSNPKLFSTIINYYGVLSARSYEICKLINKTINKMYNEDKHEEISQFVSNLKPETEKSLREYYLSLYREDKEILFPSIIKKTVRKIKSYF